MDDFVTGTRDADCDEDTQEDTHVAAEPTTEPEFLINNVAEWAAQLMMFMLNKDSMSHMNIPLMLNKSFNVCYLCQNLLTNKHHSNHSFLSHNCFALCMSI